MTLTISRESSPKRKELVLMTWSLTLSHTYGRQEMGKDPRITMIKMIFSGTPKLLDE
jgi:hypothetical protein